MLRGYLFAVLEPVGDHGPGEVLHRCNGFVSRSAVRHHAWKGGKTREPSTVRLAFDLIEKSIAPP
ncbi:MAG TPA: hypothetical protein VF647_06270 [Longimicrobium sp.]